MDPLRTLATALVATSLVAASAASAAPVSALLEAMDVPAAAIVSAGATGSESQAAVLQSLGPISPVRGDTMAVFTTGRAESLRDQVDYEVSPGGQDPLDPSSPVYDQVLLELELIVPEGAESLTFQWYFLSREYPVFVNSEYNDRFTVIQQSTEYEGNIVFDDGGNVVDINNAFFKVTDQESLEGTGFWRPIGDDWWDPMDPPAPGETRPTNEGGATGWVTTQTPVDPGETIRLRFDIHDVADAVYDSAVLIDDFQWSTTEIDDPVSGAAPEIRWLSPKSDRLEGGAFVLIEGAHLQPDFEVLVGGVRVEQSTIIGYGADALGIEIPPSPEGRTGLVDVRLITPDGEVVLENGFMFTGRRTPELPPSLAIVRPTAADPSGGTRVRIIGSSLDKVDVVRFGDTEVEFEIVSPGEIRLTSPVHAGGPVVLRVEDSAAEMAGAPLPFLFKRGGVEGRRSLIKVPGGCSAAGSTSPVGSFAMLFALLAMAGRRRRVVMGSLVVALAMVGCSSDGEIRSLRGGFPVADALIIPGDAKALEIGTNTSVVLSGERSVSFVYADLEYQWDVAEMPDGADPTIVREASMEDDRRVRFTPDLPGTYLITLHLLDRRGNRSEGDAVVVEVIPGRELNVELSWDTGRADLDLHLIRAGGTYFGDGDAFYVAPQPSWGVLSDPDDDPRYAGDHDGTGGTPPGESIRMPSVPDGDYTVLVHFFNDRLSGAVVEGELSVSVGGEEIVLPVTSREILGGEVWRAVRISMPEGTITAIDEITTHQSLGGPAVNGRG
jgi:uncharacterized protein (TIGR03382 family)